MRLQQLETTFVTYIPEQLDHGRLYISMEYATAVHLCACGCSTKTVTPLSPDAWRLTFDGTVTLRPSIGNGQAPCRSHYLITRDTITWLAPIGAEATRVALTRDQRRPTQQNNARWWQRLARAQRR